MLLLRVVQQWRKSLPCRPRRRRSDLDCCPYGRGALANLKALACKPGQSCRGHAMTAPVSAAPCHANYAALLLGGREAHCIALGGTRHHRRPVGIERHDQLVIAGLDGAVKQGRVPAERLQWSPGTPVIPLPLEVEREHGRKAKEPCRVQDNARISSDPVAEDESALTRQGTVRRRYIMDGARCLRDVEAPPLRVRGRIERHPNRVVLAVDDWTNGPRVWVHQIAGGDRMWG